MLAASAAFERIRPWHATYQGCALQAEGRAVRAKDSLKQAGEKIKDAFRRRPPRR